MIGRYSLLVVIAVLSVMTHVQITAKISAVSIFRKDEIDLHKYSAVLAAIEPYRLQLIDEIKCSLNPISYLFHRIKGRDSLIPLQQSFMRDSYR